MLITFKSKATATVTMYEEHARRILNLLHKDAKRGVITASEAGTALTKLEAEVAESRAHPTSDEVQHDIHAHHGDFGDDNEHEPPQAVSFSARAYPLLEMLREAHKGGYDILWGV
ncbi:DUF1840 domain-containing protein [Undibacterium arcticum]|uniref:DUF1840 domain-containing protein n=1 Tax=Undibacterium arcticum TaxID=1762892 RepID=A0ABV7F4Y6_9BURK